MQACVCIFVWAWASTSLTYCFEWLIFARICLLTHTLACAHTHTPLGLDSSDQTGLQHQLWAFLKQSASAGVDVYVYVCVWAQYDNKTAKMGGGGVERRIGSWNHLSLQRAGVFASMWCRRGPDPEDSESVASAGPLSDKIQMGMQMKPCSETSWWKDRTRLEPNGTPWQTLKASAPFKGFTFFFFLNCNT